MIDRLLSVGVWGSQEQSSVTWVGVPFFEYFPKRVAAWELMHFTWVVAQLANSGR